MNLAAHFHSPAFALCSCDAPAFQSPEKTDIATRYTEVRTDRGARRLFRSRRDLSRPEYAGSVDAAVRTTRLISASRAARTARFSKPKTAEAAWTPPFKIFETPLFACCILSIGKRGLLNIRFLIIAAIATASVFAGGAALGGEAPEFAPPADWVKPTASLPPPAPEFLSDPAQILLVDRQDRFADGRDEMYFAYAIRIQNPDGLAAAGSVSINWRPDISDLIIHDVKIERGDKTVDILANGQTFTVLRRETQLELAVLDGVKTATLQPEGLEVGDTLRFSYSVVEHDATLGAHSEILMTDLALAPVGKFKLRQIWNAPKNMRWRTNGDMPEPKISRSGGAAELKTEILNIKPSAIPADAPLRLQRSPQFESTDFKSWSEPASLMHPLYEKAMRLSEESPLRTEAEKIRQAAKNDPKMMTEMALRLVQDRVRYVFLGIGDGGYVPATADETWARRFGDCKGKTALLLALLHEFGVKAEAALVSSNFGDGLDKRLPLLSLFDHVIVRAELDGREYWLDGTRTGDRDLNDIDASAYRFALPIRQGGSHLVAIPVNFPETPITQTFLKIDASAGLVGKAPATLEVRMRGKSGAALRYTLNSAAPAERRQILNAVLAIAAPGIEVEQSSSAQDESSGAMIVSGEGLITLYSRVSDEGRLYYFPPPSIAYSLAALKNQADGGRKAPFVLPYPFFDEMRAEVRTPTFLPEPIPSKDFDDAAPGFSISGKVTTRDGVIELQRRLKTTAAEMSVSDALKAAAFFEGAGDRLSHFIAPRQIGEQSPGDRLGAQLDRPKSPNEMFETAMELFSQNKLGDALETIDNALALDSTIYNGLGARALILIAKGDKEAADEAIRKALDADDQDWMAFGAAGYAAAYEGNEEGAIRNFTKALEINPRYNQARRERAVAYWRTDQTDRALKEIKEAIERHPEDYEAVAILADMHMANDQFKDADALLSRSLKKVPDNHFLLNASSRLKEKRGDYRGALLDLRHAAKSNDNWRWLNNICWISATRAIEIENSLADCDRAVELSDGNAATLDSRALLHFRHGDYDLALADYDAALAQEPKQGASLYGRGLTRLKLGDADGADDIKAAIEAAPGIEAQFAEYGLVH